jgi:hypothetical protein
MRIGWASHFVFGVFLFAQAACAPRPDRAFDGKLELTYVGTQGSHLVFNVRNGMSTEVAFEGVEDRAGEIRLYGSAFTFDCSSSQASRGSSRVAAPEMHGPTPEIFKISPGRAQRVVVDAASFSGIEAYDCRVTLIFRGGQRAESNEFAR